MTEYLNAEHSMTWSLSICPFTMAASMEVLSLILSIVFVAIWAGKNYARARKRPPGPPRYPILGNLPQIAAADPFGFRAFKKLADKYGDIMSLKVGLQEMTVLSSYEVMKDLLVRDEVSGRLWTGFLQDRSMGKNLGVAFNSGPVQTQLKTFVHKKLREFGFGKRTSMEATVQVELQEVIARLRTVAAINGGHFVMERFFQLTLLNVLWSMLAGKRYAHDDPKLAHLLKVNSSWFQSGNFGAGIVTAYPFLRFIFPEWTGYNSQKHGNEVIYAYLREMIREHRQREGYATDPQSFIDIFLAEIDQNRGQSKNVDGEGSAFTDEQFIVTCYDMFQAGFETTSNTLAFGMLFMVLNPGVQAKVQKELDELIPGRTRPLCMDDRERLPYTRATVLEVFRMSNILPISGPRLAMEDTYYKEYLIPKNTAVTFNTYAVMRSPKHWGPDPDTFRPERFLNPETGELNELQQYMQIGFGAGRRSCLGESLAQTTVWMYFTTLLQHFTFSQVPGKDAPSTEPVFGIILSPQPYEVIVRVRD